MRIPFVFWTTYGRLLAVANNLSFELEAVEALFRLSQERRNTWRASEAIDKTVRGTVFQSNRIHRRCRRLLALLPLELSGDRSELFSDSSTYDESLKAVWKLERLSAFVAASFGAPADVSTEYSCRLETLCESEYGRAPWGAVEYSKDVVTFLSRAGNYRTAGMALEVALSKPTSTYEELVATFALYSAKVAALQFEREE